MINEIYLREGKYLQVARSRVTHQTLIVNIQRWVTLEREKLTTCKTDFCMGNKITPRFKRVFKAFPRYTVMACIVPHTILAPSFPSDRPTGVLSLFNFSRMRHDAIPILSRHFTDSNFPLISMALSLKRVSTPLKITFPWPVHANAGTL